MSLREDYDRLFLPTYAPPQQVLTRGEGATVWDTEGREYIDFGGGIAVLSLGHSANTVLAAIREQSERLMHTSNLFVNDAAVLLAKRLCQETFAECVFLCNSGGEANEAALKLARRRGQKTHPEKYRVLSFDGGFHGRIGLAMAATAQAKIRDGFGPLAPGFLSTPFNDISAADEVVDDTLCAIIVEPIQGEAGVHSATVDFLRKLRELANRHDAVLIFDEVQCGAGRTGDLYVYQNMGITPDVLTTAKGLGGGIPFAAMLAGEAVSDALETGSHGTTFGGNPLASGVALAVLDTLLADGFLDGVKERGEFFISRLHKINDTFGCFSEIRGHGLFIGCDLKESLNAKAVVAAALEEGLIVITAGENSLRFVPCLNISEDIIETGLARLNKALKTIIG